MKQNAKEELMSVKLDWTFKELMLNEEVRNGFISAVLGVKIKSSAILNTYLRKNFSDDKLGILDVYVELIDKTQIDIEIQVVAFKEWAERTLFYTSKMYVSQIKEGDAYKALNKCINISILDFNYLDEPKFLNRFHIRNDETNKLYTDKIEFNIIELPKIPKELETINDLVLWCKFIDADSEEEIKMIATKNKSIGIAYEELKRLSQDEQKRMEYEDRQKAIRDYNSLMRQFIEEGEQIGLAKGRVEGEKIGEQKGAYNKAIKTAKNFLNLGIDINTIAKGTGLSVEEISKLKSDIN